MMKIKILLSSAFLLFLVSCSSCKVPFMHQAMWIVDEHDATIKEVSCQLEFPLDSLYVPHFSESIQLITKKNDYRRYAGSIHQVKAMLKQIPMKADTLLFVVPNKMIVFESLTDNWDPDCDIISRGRRRQYIGCVHNELIDTKTNEPYYVDRMMARGKWICVVYLHQFEERAKDMSREFYRKNLYFRENEP